MVHVPLLDLWLPILLSTVIVFFAGFITHMVLPYHHRDYVKLPDEEKARTALSGVPAGNYTIPNCIGPAGMKDPVWLKKCEEGPVGYVHMMPSGQMAMGKFLGQQFVTNLLITVVVAYLVGRTLPAGTDYLAVFRVAGTAAFLAYVMGEPVYSIWYGRNWSTTFKNMFDGVLYALLTAGVFGWLWPAA